MITKHETTIEKDLANKKLKITREFNAPVEKVWKAWTDSKVLDLWWAPKPYKTETKSQDFREGGEWLYSMVGPEGERHFCKADYVKIVSGKSYEYLDGFCDENGTLNKDFPRMQWHVVFEASASGTRVEIAITFDSVASLEKIVEMGFKEGFTMAHGNLDEVLAQ